MAFQKSVNLVQAPGVAGDFLTANPRSSKPTGSPTLQAGPNGLTVGLFAWQDSTGTLLNNSGSGAPAGFVHREMAADITTYLAEYGMTIPAGQRVGGLFNGGDFQVLNAGSTTAVVGQKAYASLTNGTISFANAGATVADSVETKWYCVTLINGGTGLPGELVGMSDTPLG